MNRQTFHRFILAILIGLAVYIAVLVDVYALETFVIGGEENPWGQSGSFELIDMSDGSIRPLQLKPDENLLLGALGRGGRAFAVNRRNPPAALHPYEDPEELNRMIDGDTDTAYQGVQHYGTHYYFDLGGVFPVNRIRFYPREAFPDQALPTFELVINDGNPRDVDRYNWPLPQVVVLSRPQAIRDPVVGVGFPLRFVRYVGVVPVGLEFRTTWEIAEMEVYGEGYVPEASYTSDIIDLGGEASFGRISWSGRRDLGAKVFIQTRSGMDDDPNVYWRRTGRGDEITNLSDLGKLLTKKDYNKLPKLEQGPITYDSENWSFWSAPYDFEGGLEGVSITSPGPRRFFQLRVDFVSTPTDGTKIDFIRFDLSKPPAAWEIVAEIFPLDVEPGEVVTFIYAVRPTIMRDNPGFDSLEIRTPARVTRVRSVRIDLLEVDFSFELLDDPAGFVVHFPDDRMDVGGNRKLLEVIFDAVVFRYGTAFEGRVFDSRSDEVPQSVRPGNATDRLGGDDLLVRTSLGGALISSVDVSPNPFTPNGDHINDVANISYSLLRLTDVAPVFVDIYSLSGAFIRSVYVGWDLSGHYSCIWDGTDDDGRLVAPGVYLYRVSVDADKGRESRTGTVAVVY